MIQNLRRGEWNTRQAFFLENDRLSLAFLPGGGHIAAMMLKQGAAANLNPLWQPPWPSLEPMYFNPEKDYPPYGGPPEGRLLASIMGHNLCFDYFGASSGAEEAQGYGVHGEAPVSTWVTAGTQASRLEDPQGPGPEESPDDDGPSQEQPYSELQARAVLFKAKMEFVRRLRLWPGRQVVEVHSTAENLNHEPRWVGWQEHVTFGPPFLEKGVTVFDCSAKWCRVTPEAFYRLHRLELAAEFKWPHVPSSDGSKGDLRICPSVDINGDFTTQLMDPAREWAWFTAMNPRLGLLMGYLWRREDFPWMGLWEENFSRDFAPWHSKTLARGMEFGWQPQGGREALVRQKELKGVPVVRQMAPNQKVAATF